MATRQGRGPTVQVDKTAVVEWSGLLNTDDGTAVDAARYPDKTVQVTGTFGVGGSVRIQGANNAALAWNAVKDPQGVDLNITDTKPRLLESSPKFLRPLVTAGDGATNLTVTIICIARGA